MSGTIKAIETQYHGYRFRSRLEARWAVFFDSLGLKYEYEVEGFDMEGRRYLPDFYIPSLNRWFEIKGNPMTIEDMKKCEEFCRRLGNENTKFSILIGAPQACQLTDENGNEFFGIEEFTWEWPSEVYPDNYRLEAPTDLVDEEYYSRFVRGIWVVPEKRRNDVTSAIKAARGARFEYGETPKV